MNIPAIYGYSFLKANLGYFGTLSFENNGVSFNGKKKSFLMKDIEVNKFYDFQSLQSVNIEWTKVIISTDLGVEKFKLAVLYNVLGIDSEEHLTNVVVGGGTLGLALRDLAKSRRYDKSETAVVSLHKDLIASIYESKTNAEIGGFRRSQATMLTVLFWIAITVIFLGFILFAFVNIKSKLS